MQNNLRMIYYRNDLQTRYEDGSLLGVYSGIPDPDAYFFKEYIIWPNGTIYDLYQHKYLTPYVNQNGYLSVVLKNHFPTHTVSKILLLHRLVAINFIEKTAEDYYYDRNQVNHISGDKTDCSVENLEFANAKENVRHSIHTGLSHINNYYNIKPQILEDFKSGMTVAEVYEKYKDTGIKKSTLQNYKIEAVGYTNNAYLNARTDFIEKNIDTADKDMLYDELVDNDFEMTPHLIKRIADRMGFKSNRVNYTEFYDDVEKMLKDGIDPQIIADKFGIKQNTVRKFANRRLGMDFKPKCIQYKDEIKARLKAGASIKEIMSIYGDVVGESTVAEWKRQIFGKRTDCFLSNDVKAELISDIQSGMAKSELYAKYRDKMSTRTIRNYINKCSTSN